MSLDPETRFRIRYILVAIILATLPCYCAGLFLVNQVQQRAALPDQTATPTFTLTATFTVTPSPSLAPTLTETPTPTLTATLTATGTTP
ncbi:MAG: hypothetical protein GX495_02725, partial [Chloroflexi bacterium]|nr:hypothetical protein [Chloroflexota bacterium]